VQGFRVHPEMRERIPSYSLQSAAAENHFATVP
jgi:hypothetical protein